MMGCPHGHDPLGETERYFIIGAGIIGILYYARVLWDLWS